MVWTLVLHHTPLLTAAGTTGQIEELAQATGRSLTFNLDAPHELTFSLPGKHPTTALVRKGLTDVLAYRDDVAVMRFRVTNRSLTRNGSSVGVQVTCLSYRAVIDRHMFHTGDPRSWTATPQSLIAWEIADYGQRKAFGALGMVRGVVPPASLDKQRDRVGSPATETETATQGYDAGKSRGEAIAELGRVADGFEWDIRPVQDSIHQSTFDVWARRGVVSTFALDDGGNVGGWTAEDDLDDFANVIRVVGREPTGENTNGAAGPVVYLPGTHDPDTAYTSYGRIEMERASDAEKAATVNEQAQGMLAEAYLGLEPTWSLTLRAGRWQGLDDLWLGDRARLLIRVDTVHEPGVFGDPLIDVEQTVRVQAMTIGLEDNSGRENVAVTVGRPPMTWAQLWTDLQSRLARGERR